MFDKNQTFEWQGVSYEILVTMELVEAVDSKYNLFDFAMEMADTKVQVSVIANIISMVLSSGDKNITPIQFYRSMGGKNMQKAFTLLTDIIAVLMPGDDDAELSEAPKKKTA